MKKKITEADLAKIVSDYFKEQGYEVYNEVLANKTSKRADMILLKDGIYTNIETKLTFSNKLLEQVYFWKHNSHKAYLCIPSKRDNLPSKNKFLHKVCEDYGIGIIYVYFNKSIPYVSIELESSFNSEPENLPELFSQQKESFAGTNKGGYITPFKITCGNIVSYLQSINKEVEIGELLNNISHHYKNNASAKQSIIKMINWNVLENISFIKKENKYFICLK